MISSFRHYTIIPVSEVTGELEKIIAHTSIYDIAVCNLFVQECHKPPVTEQDVNDPRFVWYCNKCSKNMKKMVRTAHSCNLVISSLPRVTEDFSYICNCPMLFLPVHYSGGICAVVYVPEL